MQAAPISAISGFDLSFLRDETRYQTSGEFVSHFTIAVRQRQPDGQGQSRSGS